MKFPIAGATEKDFLISQTILAALLNVCRTRVRRKETKSFGEQSNSKPDGVGGWISEMSSIWQPTLLCLALVVFFGEETDKTEKLLSRRQSNQIQHDRER